MSITSILKLYITCGTVLYAGGLYAEESVVPGGLAVKPAAPIFANDPVSTQGIVQMALGLALVVTIIFLLAWLVRRMGGMRGYAGGSLRVLGGMSVGAREKVVLMQVGDAQLLLGVAPGRIQTLHVLENPVVVSDDASTIPTSAFAERLKAALKRTPE